MEGVMSNSRGKKGKSFLAVLFCVPLAFIIYFAISYTSTTLGNVEKVTVAVSSTQSTVFESNEDVDFFVGMITRSLSINTPMRDISGEIPVSIIFDREDKAIEYKLYPSLNLSGCLLVGPEDKLSVLETDAARTLLLRPEFEYLYASQQLPTLEVVSGDKTTTIYPTSDNAWTYYKIDGSAQNSSLAYDMTEQSVTILKGAENTLRFTPDGETRPYKLTDVSYIAENGNQYTITDISELDLSADTLISVSFTAVWEEASGNQPFGHAKYEFDILYDVPAVIELPKTEFTLGDVIEVRASHINADEVVTLNTMLDVGELKFEMTDATNAVAYLPISLDNAVGEYTFDFLTGIGKISENITVSPRDETGLRFFSVSVEDFNSMLTTEKMSELYSELSTLTLERRTGLYFTPGKSMLRAPVKGTSSIKFGQAVVLGTEEVNSDSGKRVCDGVVYEFTKKTNVTAAQSGEVIYVGEPAPTGNTVVLYHGCGLYTYYYHLDSVTVETGKNVTAGDLLGVTGSTGYTNGKNVLQFCASIDGVFVDPLLLIK